MARLGDVFLLVRNGANIQQGEDNTGYPITRIETISDRVIDRNKMGYAGIHDIEIYKDYVLQDGDILMSHINSEKHLGKVALYTKEGCEQIIHGMNLLCLRPNHDIISSQYAYFYFSSLAFLTQISHITKKSVNQASFTVSALKELSMPIPSIQEQTNTSKILSSIDALIALRKKQLQKLDDLVKARFVEMFGDPVTNPLGWEQVTLKDVAKGKLSYGSGVSATDFDGNLRYVRITDITENGDLNNDRKSPDQFDEKYLLHDGDILFARSGATVGKTFCYAERKHGRAIYAGYLIRMIPDTSKVLPTYVFYYTKTEYYASFVANAQRAVAQPNINAQEYGDLIICVPPMELQQQFAVFVSQVDKSKLSIQQSLEKLETLKQSLMQQYFG